MVALEARLAGSKVLYWRRVRDSVTSARCASLLDPGRACMPGLSHPPGQAAGPVLPSASDNARLRGRRRLAERESYQDDAIA